MGRQFQHLRLSREACLGLREAVRPFADTHAETSQMVKLCIRLYLALYRLEADPDLETVDLRVDQDEVLIVNHFVSVEDGDWAKDILHQTRQALFELATGREAVRLASSEDAGKLFEGVNLDLDQGGPEVKV